MNILGSSRIARLLVGNTLPILPASAPSSNPHKNSRCSGARPTLRMVPASCIGIGPASSATPSLLLTDITYRFLDHGEEVSDPHLTDLAWDSSSDAAGRTPEGPAILC